MARGLLGSIYIYDFDVGMDTLALLIAHFKAVFQLNIDLYLNLTHKPIKNTLVEFLGKVISSFLRLFPTVFHV